MLDTKDELINFLLYFICNLLLIGLQSSLWPEFFGTFPAPFFFIYSLIFFALYHPVNWTIAFNLVGVALLSAFSIVPIEVLLFTTLLVSIFLFEFKKRVLWKGASYFALCSFMAVTLFHILYYLLSWMIEVEETGIAHIQWGFWFFQSLTSVILSPVFYWIYIQLEANTRGFDTSDVEEAL